ncbi:MAG: PIG-L family deacetylase [Proteobacteria bacterium]|nr:PIG-L family deacetylase [Pseudomonadota bacterium]
MKGFSFPPDLKSIVCLGAHPDDIEIGAGGLVSSLRRRFPDATFRFVVVTGSEERTAEALASADGLLGDRGDIVVGDFTDGFVPYENPGDVKRFVRSALPSGTVDLVIAPQPDDPHQDHSFVAALAGQLFRNQVILGYEIAKFDGGLTAPNLYVPLSSSEATDKVAHLRASFPSQLGHHWFSDDSFLGLMRLRGIESNAPDGYAEGFVTAKMVIGVDSVPPVSS